MIKVEEFACVGGIIRGEAREVAEEFAWVGEIRSFGRAIFVHEESIIGGAELGEVGGEISSFLSYDRETAEVSANPSPQLPAFTMRGGAFHTKLSRK